MAVGRFLRTAYITVCALLFGCSHTPAARPLGGQWLMYQREPSHNAVIAGTLRTAWLFDAGAKINGDLAVVGGTVFLDTFGKELIVLDLGKGTVRWRARAAINADATCEPSAPRFSQDQRTAADRWISQGVIDLQSSNFYCARSDFANAAVLYRHQTQSVELRDDARVNLAFALSQEGVSLSKLGYRKLAARTWAQAARLRVPPAGPNIELADRLFGQRRYAEAFKMYQDLASSVPMASVGAAGTIDDGVTLVANGRYREALAVFRKASPWQATYFLEGQVATILGDYKTAYNAYVNELLVHLQLPALPPGPSYGTVFDRPAMLRLVAIAGP